MCVDLLPHEIDKSPAENLRKFIKDLHEEDDLVSITTEVDPDLEVAAIIRRACEIEDKAPLFNNVKGRKDANGLFRILGCPVGASKLPGKRFIRIAKSIGLPSTATAHEIIQKLNGTKSRAAIPPKECANPNEAPVKDFKLFGDYIDLTQLPIPFLHEHDGGKFLQTFGMCVVQSPDGSWVNWSITRSMLHGKRSLVGPCMPRQDIGVIRQMWTDLGKDMPFALCFGVPPAAAMVSGMPLPRGVNETGYIGALLGKPVEVVRCETSEICVPADAEIIFEGVVSRTETAPEGPMAEYHGMIFPGESKPCPVFNINAITYRRDPILPLCVTGRAPDESTTVWGVTIAAEVLSICQKAGLPVTMSWSPFEAHCMWFVLQVDRAKLRSLDTNMEEFCKKVGHTVFGSKPGFYIPKLFLVGEDIDPTNLNEVIWAESGRCQPRSSEFLFDEYPNIGLIPYVSHAPKTGPFHYKVVKCCLFPEEFHKEITWVEASFKSNYPQHIRDKVENQWKAYGF